MGSHRTWSVRLGSWGGLQVRIHSLFLLFAAFTLLFGWKASQGETEDGLTIAGGSLAILLLSVLLHELSHYLAACRLGGDGNEVILGPFGGLSSMRPPLEPAAEAVMHLAGPLLHLAVCLLAGGVLLASGTDLLAMLHPLAPSGLVEGEHTWILATKLTFWINWVLLLVNLLPVFPFDGGRALRAALSSVWPTLGPRRASAIVSTIAKLAALGLLVVAILFMLRPSPQPPPVPAWFALLLLAIFLYFSAKQEADRHEEREDNDEPFGYDFSQGYTSLERTEERVQEPPGPVQRWLENRRQVRLQRQQEIEEEEESRVDDILSRLHAHGIENLSQEDRSLLDRVSARYRFRNSR